MLSRGKAIDILIANAVCTSSMACDEHCPFYIEDSEMGGVKCSGWSEEMLKEAVETVKAKEVPFLKSVDDLGEVRLGILKAFVEADMNVSRAADMCFVHRNTIVYHLEKIQKATGKNPHVLRDIIDLIEALGLRREADDE